MKKKYPLPVNLDRVILISELIQFLYQFPMDGEVWLGDGNGLSNECKHLSVLDITDVILSHDN